MLLLPGLAEELHLAASQAWAPCENLTRVPALVGHVQGLGLGHGGRVWHSGQ